MTDRIKQLILKHIGRENIPQPEDQTLDALALEIDKVIRERYEAGYNQGWYDRGGEKQLEQSNF